MKLPIRQGKWKASARFEQASLANELGIPLSVFDAWSAEDKAYAIQARRTRMRMETWDNQQAEEKIEKQNLKGRRGN